MDLVGLYLSNPFWWWVAAAALFLAIEVATGTQMLLWPSAAAGVVAVLLLLGLKLRPGVDLSIFAVLTIVATLLARRFVHRPGAGPDINDPLHRLIGHKGEAAGPFQRGRGRIFVDGKEWGAELDEERDLAKGDRLEVVEVLDGGRLKVRAVP